MAGTPRDTFPLRFKNPGTREALKHLAEHSGRSMTDIAERAIEHEIALQGADLERRLAQAMAIVRGYSASADADTYIDEAAAGERSGLDPMREVRALHAPEASTAEVGAPDPYGVLAAFRHS